MNLFDQIKEDIKAAMKGKKQERVEALRFLQSAIKYKEIEIRPNALTNDDVLNVIKKLVKQRKESIEQYEKAGRTDLAQKESAELMILEEYLPKQMGASEIEALVLKVMATFESPTIKQMGAIMKEVMSQSKGAADNKTISEIVKSKLS